MNTERPSESGRRWEGRPLTSLALRILAFVSPVFAALAVAAVTADLLPAPDSNGALAIWWVTFVGSSIVTFLFFDRLARRLVPLSTLLKMSLLFPDKAPSRLLVAQRSGRVRDLKKKVDEARAKGVDDEPTRAASDVLALIATLSAHDRRTRGHSERVRAFIDLLGGELSLSESDRERLRWAGLLHDIGKLAVSVDILNNPGKPTADEWDQLRRHPSEGRRIIAPLANFLGDWAGTVEHHHEKFDGSGYPQGLSGEAISLGGRIAAVADSFEVMTAARPYKHPMSAEDARTELARCSGSQFDPTLVRAFLNISIGRLWRTIGFASWIAQFPVFRQLSFRGLLDRAARAGAFILIAVMGTFMLRSSGALTLPTSASQQNDAGQGERSFGDPQDATAEVQGNRAVVTWSVQTDVTGYSIAWSQQPLEIPDTTVDLHGSAGSAESPPLDPGGWFFHLRTQGTDGSWTSTIHLPFQIVETLKTARVDGPYVSALTGVSSRGSIRADAAHLQWTFTPNCPSGACDLRMTVGNLTQPFDLFTFDGDAYHARVQVPMGRCPPQVVSIDFEVSDARFTNGVWKAIELTGAKSVETAPGRVRGCDPGSGTWTFVATAV